MHDAIKIKLDGWHSCPTWWKNMVEHLIHVHTHAHAKPWHDLDTIQIIHHHVNSEYGALYLTDRYVQFPSESEYCACVLAWS
jgi:hypothetical protein